jgi:hypothetical protein
MLHNGRPYPRGVDPRVHAVAVVFDLVQPVFARRRFLYEARQLRLNPFGWPRCRFRGGLEHVGIGRQASFQDFAFSSGGVLIGAALVWIMRACWVRTRLFTPAVYE